MPSPTEVRAAVEAEVLEQLAVLAAHHPGAALPGVELLDERVDLAGPGFVPRSAFRILATADGWLALSLPRAADRELVPALVEAPVDTTTPEACWSAVRSWAGQRSAADAEARGILLGLPLARISAGPVSPRRAPVAVTRGGVRPRAGAPRVVDLSALWAGPLAARLLAVTGARVLKVESRARPDRAGPGLGAFHDRLQPAGRESLVLDFEDRADLARLRDLVLSADVVVEASRPRALRQLGISADEAIDRGVVWCSITAYGREGSDGLRIGFGDDVAAGAGLLARSGAEPVAVGDALADPLTGVTAAAAVATALAAGTGALLDVSMHDVSASAAARY